MLKNGIQWLMILLIALQSVGSLADAHSGHQSGIEHLDFEHDHSSESQVLLENSPQDQATNSNYDYDYDCHHCCHCHGAHTNFISSYIHNFATYGRSPQHSFKQLLAVSQQVQSLYRPPRYA